MLQTKTKTHKPGISVPSRAETYEDVEEEDQTGGGGGGQEGRHKEGGLVRLAHAPVHILEIS
jgi:hypothetical protein